MGSKLYIHQIRYEKEYNILFDLTEKLIDLRDAAKKLRPECDSYEISEDEKDRKQKRLSQYGKAYQSLYEIVEKRRPFYPEEIYTILRKFDKVAYKEAIQYKNRSPSKEQQGHYDDQYWEKAADLSAEISQLAEDSIEAIRNRVRNPAKVYSETGMKLDASRLRKQFRLAVKKSRIENFKFHDLRHTFATRLAQGGVDIYLHNC